MRVATVSQLHTIEQAYWLAQWCAGLHAGALIYMCVCENYTHTNYNVQEHQLQAS